MSGRIKTGVLISGRGSNMSALVAAAKAADYPAEIVLVLSDTPGAKGLETAAADGIETDVVQRARFDSRDGFETALADRLDAAGCEIICLAGFMRLLTSTFISRFRGRILNIHPSLLPKFPGLDTHERALAAGEREHGCSVHFVNEGMDEGPVIGQARVPVEPDDSPDSLAARVIAREHQLYPACLKLVAERAVSYESQLMAGEPAVRL